MRGLKVKRVLFAGTAIGLAMQIVGGVSMAQQTAPAEQESAGSEEIIVTAQRRAQKAQDTGLALSVIGGGDLEEKNISTVNDLENNVPALEVDSQFGGGQPQFRIRGIGAREYSSNNSSTVGIYIDEVAHPYTVTTQGALFDIARIEVLRGPQGTLYGRNTTGGAVNVITASPTEVFEAGLTAEYGSYDRFSAEGFVSGPINDKLRFRLAAFTEQGGAWQYNRDTGEELGDKDRLSLRGRLNWDISDTINFDLSLTWARDKSDGLGFRLLTPYTPTGGAGPTIPADTAWRITGWRISPELAAIAGVGLDAKPFRDNEGFDVSSRLNFDLGSVLLTSVTAYQNFDRREYNDWDGTRYYESDVFFYNEISVFTQEFRLTSQSDGPLEWLAGVYYANESNDGGFHTQFRGIPGILNSPYAQEVEAIGVFAHGSYAVSDTFSIVGGLRYEYEERSISSPGTTNTAGTVNTGAYSKETDLSELSGKIGIEYKAAPDVLLYANIARGVKSGGFTTYNATRPEALPFKPEVVWAYEAGVKSEFFNRRLRLNASAFYYDYKDQQVQGLLYDTAVGRLGQITNVPESHIYGGELELAWQIADGLNLSQWVSYKVGAYDEYFAIDGTATDAANPVNGPWTVIISNDRSGERLGFPRWNYGGALSYDWTIGNVAIRAETNYSYRSDLYSVTTTSVIPGYWLANASIGFGPVDANWRVTLWGRNIFNEYFEETRNGFNGSARRTASVHPPRTWGVRVNLSY